jgi:hypothetical protein
LTLNTPRSVKYVRFRWDGNNDIVNELEIERNSDPGDPTYDFVHGEPAFESTFATETSQFLDPFSFETARHQIGFTGVYEGEIYPLGSNPVPKVQVRLRDAGNEIRGRLVLLDDNFRIYLGSLCGYVTLPAGTDVEIRMTPWASYDGRFSEFDSFYYPPGDVRHFGTGSTTRTIKTFLASGQLQITLYAMVQVGVSDSWLTADIEFNAPSPCTDGTFSLLSLRDDTLLYQSLH